MRRPTKNCIQIANFEITIYCLGLQHVSFLNFYILKFFTRNFLMENWAGYFGISIGQHIHVLTFKYLADIHLLDKLVQKQLNP